MCFCLARVIAIGTRDYLNSSFESHVDIHDHIHIKYITEL